MVELDVRRAADGTLVVHHDAVLDDGRLIIELPGPDLPDWLPDLETALVACEGMAVNIEIKNSPRDADFDPDDVVAGGVVDLVARLHMRDRVIVSSFNLRTVDAVRATDTGVRTGWLTFPGTDLVALIAAIAAGGHTAVHPYDTSVTAASIDAAHDAGLEVNAWTVDDVDRMKELAGWGVDGIVTNDPAAAVAALRAR